MSEDKATPKPLQPTELELKLARQAIKEQQLKERAFRALIRLDEKLKNKPHVSKAGRPTGPTSKARAFGLRLLEQGKLPSEEIIRRACPLDPAYMEMLDAQKAKYEDTFWDSITTAQ